MFRRISDALVLLLSICVVVVLGVVFFVEWMVQGE